jgi:hypothetical protein
MKTEQDYPAILEADHIAEILNISKHVAYKIMEKEDFPLIRVNKFKRVKRDSFFQWLETKK